MRRQPIFRQYSVTNIYKPDPYVLAKNDTFFNHEEYCKHHLADDANAAKMHREGVMLRQTMSPMFLVHTFTGIYDRIIPFKEEIQKNKIRGIYCSNCFASSVADSNDMCKVHCRVCRNPNNVTNHYFKLKLKILNGAHIPIFYDGELEGVKREDPTYFYAIDLHVPAKPCGVLIHGKLSDTYYKPALYLPSPYDLKLAEKFQ
jgi:hypothetical protein